jgi:hypothetical protein
MPGSIRFLLGLLIVFGASGADIATPNTQILAVAAVGILLMISGATQLKKAS